MLQTFGKSNRTVALTLLSSLTDLVEKWLFGNAWTVNLLFITWAVTLAIFLAQFRGRFVEMVLQIHGLKLDV